MKKENLLKLIEQTDTNDVSKRFDTSDDTFQSYLKRLFNGDGNEEKNFYAKDSSSRLSCLCFYSWMKGGGINLNGTLFTSCYLEAKNKVIRKPSNVDVLLVSQDQKTLMYLESKFTEYVRDANQKATLRNGYFQSKKLQPLILELIDAKFIDKNENADGTHNVHSTTYPQGIKQMISHFIGVCKGPSKQEKKDDYDTLFRLWNNAERIDLGSILYKFDDPEFDSYCKCHKQLAQTLNQCKFGPKATTINVIEEPFTYQQLVQACPLPNRKIANYYHL
jgi:hypothetical protein